MVAFNEDSRVKFPTLYHLIGLGYQYLPIKGKLAEKYDPYTNIFTYIFFKQLLKINPGIGLEDIKQFYNENIVLELENEDLGEAFYTRLMDQSAAIKLIDFNDFDNNSFHVATELTYKNGKDEFRPDITILINGLPLVFLEVKKPNNPQGTLAEFRRINSRFQNKNFRKFANIIQFMIFSNNMEYDDEDRLAVQGAYYASPSYVKHSFNHFREEDQRYIKAVFVSEEEEIAMLRNNGAISLLNNAEYQLNKEHNKPTNRICSSLLSRERLAYILQYGLAYVRGHGYSLQKHIMRYPQIFGTKAIRTYIDKGNRRGIIWHTQGSGKTALAYYSVKVLTHYYRSRKEGVIPKFYFIVDRLDLLEQAKNEFLARGLIVRTVDSKEAFAKELRSNMAILNNEGKPEITVVNIHKFKDDYKAIKESDYNIEVQRIYFLDEVHRSYSPKGSFLSNLRESDKNAILIGLTGTPLLKNDPKATLFKEHSSTDLFGDYIHKYYYNASIADGYTLRLMREEIDTSYKMELAEILSELEIEKGSISKKDILAHHKFVKPLLKYIVDDFMRARITWEDYSVGGMVICDSSEQAKALFEAFQKHYAKHVIPEDQQDDPMVYSAALILHDVGSKDERKEWVDDFKKGKIDLLFVYNMLLTGFDAPRLKKLYMGRLLKRHNLLQAITRVNRTYKDYRYGYIVDFADIKREFDETNQAYLNELQEELGDDFTSYTDLFVSQAEITDEIEEINRVLWDINTENAEVFSEQLNGIHSKERLIEIRNALQSSRQLYNIIRLFGYDRLANKLDFNKLNQLYIEAQNHLSFLNFKESIVHSQGNREILNQVLNSTEFIFRKIDEEELTITEKEDFKEALRRVQEELRRNIDPKDPEYITIAEEFERVFRNNKFSMEEKADLDRVYREISYLNQKNDRLLDRYENDAKFVRVHRQIAEKEGMGEYEIYQVLMEIKEATDQTLSTNRVLLENSAYFKRSINRNTFMAFEQYQQEVLDEIEVSEVIAREYLDEFEKD